MFLCVSPPPRRLLLVTVLVSSIVNVEIEWKYSDHDSTLPLVVKCETVKHGKCLNNDSVYFSVCRVIIEKIAHIYITVI